MNLLVDHFISPRTVKRSKLLDLVRPPFSGVAHPLPRRGRSINRFRRDSRTSRARACRVKSTGVNVPAIFRSLNERRRESKKETGREKNGRPVHAREPDREDARVTGN